MRYFRISFDNFLSQMVLQSTRGNNILDLLLSNYGDMVCDVKIGNLYLITILLRLMSTSIRNRKSSKKELKFQKGRSAHAVGLYIYLQ